MKRATFARLTLTSLAGALGLFCAAPASAATCNISFGQASGLKAMPDQAIGFATSPFYTHVCGGIAIPNAFKVDENGGSIFGHFHIAADDPAVNCFTTNATYPAGVMGRQIGAGPCVAIDPLATSRYVAIHTTTQWIRVRTASTTRWRATQIKVMGTVTAKVLIEQTDGTWWQFTNLTPGTWNLGNTGKFAKNAFVQNQSTAGGPMSFDNFVVEHNL